MLGWYQHRPRADVEFGCPNIDIAVRAVASARSRITSTCLNDRSVHQPINQPSSQPSKPGQLHIQVGCYLVSWPAHHACRGLARSFMISHRMRPQVMTWSIHPGVC
eukprot:2264328-Alexandrium_andersonii.AAC.1